MRTSDPGGICVPHSAALGWTLMLRAAEACAFHMPNVFFAFDEFFRIGQDEVGRFGHSRATIIGWWRAVDESTGQ